MIDHICLLSGGHSSGKVAIEVAKKYGTGNMILLNHNINKSKEDPDVKRFKNDIANYLKLPITFANIGNILDDQLIPDQFDISLKEKAFKQPGTGNALCTFQLKTEPFHNFLKLNYPEKNCVIYYGFDDDEQARINRRTQILNSMGYKVEFPLAHWPDTLEDIQEIGIKRPLSYADYIHGNCKGCLKGGIQHWFVTYCKEPEVYIKAEETEKKLNYSILTDRSNGGRVSWYLSELRPIFERMKRAGVPQTEHFSNNKFKIYLKKYKLPEIEDLFSCECSIK